MALFGSGGSLFGNGALTTLTPSIMSPNNNGTLFNWFGNAVPEEPLIDLSEILKVFGASVNSAIASASTNAIAAEREESALNRLFQQTSADKAMQFESDQAEISRQFYKDLSDTAYQRAVVDMKAAGLNPILAYTQGGSSSSAVAGATGKVAAGGQANIAAAKNADTTVLSAYAQLVHGFGEIIKGLGEVIPG